MRDFQRPVGIGVVAAEADRATAHQQDVDVDDARAVPERARAAHLGFDSFGVHEQTFRGQIRAHLQQQHGG